MSRLFKEVAFDRKLEFELFMGCSLPPLGLCRAGVIDLWPTSDSFCEEFEYREEVAGTECFFLPMAGAYAEG